MEVEVGKYLEIFQKVANRKGWKLNPDRELLKDFAKGLIENKRKYGIAICPCRLPTGKREIDKLIICPCVYADEDIRDFGRCYCGLYWRRDDKDYSEVVVPDRHAKYYKNGCPENPEL
ncbi:MAG: ferredoxin-thioredoxin reductase [Archaeoglobus sp.]|jgi:ferredoxin-thioredoxin reductase catalytic subunit|nr:ferredoxin-thioredoxin reductase [Archaeoglobus sp.]